ncbi:MAG: glycosidase [Candidatus Cloacimonadota bacterium]|nr:MAG: glycosidase [Candidatus Cloacimonadota bacterium]
MKRYVNNPIVTRNDIPKILPYLRDVTSVFNPGAIRFDEKILLMLRVQNRARETYFVMASSEDGINFNAEDKIVHWQGIKKIQETIFHIYDPRITKLDDVYYIMFAMDMASGCYLGLGKTLDFRLFEFMGIVSNEDNRNGVLFSEKVGGKYLRLDRPNKVQLEDGPLTGSSIWLSQSDDLIKWEAVREIISGRNHYWDELIGAGPPPVKTDRGWLCVYHGIAMHYQPIYQAGVMLLDLDDPSKVIARGRYNILEPRELYETVGQVPNVIFPTGIIIDEFDENGFAKPESKVSIYYGAADTSVGMANSTIHELIELCFEE